MCKVNIALQEPQAVSLMLHRMVFHLTGKVVALHMDSNTAEAYLCNQGGRVSLSPSRMACHILNQALRYGITLILAYILPISLWKPAVNQRKGWFQNGILFLK